MGSVTIRRRARAWRDLAREYAVEIDGEKVGSIARGEELRFEVADGSSHLVRLKIDWCYSPTITVDSGEDALLECGSGGNPLTGIFDIIFRRNDYIDLHRV